MANSDERRNRRLLEAGLFAAAYLAASEVGYFLSLGPSVGGTFWPPSGVALAVLLAAPRRNWLALALAAAGANFLSDMVHSQPLPAAVVYAGVNIGEPLLGAWLLRRVLRVDPDSVGLREIIAIACVSVLVSTPLASLFGALAAEAWAKDPPGLATSWRTWWVGDAVGAVVIAPGLLRLLGWLGRARVSRQALVRLLRRVPSSRWLELTGFIAAITLVTEVVFDAPPTSPAFAFLVFPVMLWASVRFRLLGVAAALVWVVLLTTHHTAAGHGPFAAPLALGDRLVALQIYVGVLAVSFQTLTVLLEERGRAFAELERAQRGLEARYRRLVEQSPFGILTLGPDGEAKEVNPAWRRLWGSTSPHEQGREDPRWKELDLARHLERAASGESVALPDTWVHPAGGPSSDARCLRGLAYPVKSEAGAVDETVIITQDVTAERNAEREREYLLEAERSARTEAERVSRLKDDFLATLSHELRTPLSAVLGWAQILQKREQDPATLARGLATIERNARAQTALIEDLLDMSRILAGKLSLTRVPVALAEIVGSAADALRPAAHAKGVTLSADLRPSAIRVDGDASRLGQVVTNLIGNAIKFTPKGGNVEVEVGRRGDFAIVEVRDDGRGIEPDVVDSLFDRFRQADASTTRAHGGLGLGLSIAKQIVEMHGGTIEGRSEGIGKGSIFTLRLPSLEQSIPAESAAQPSVDLTGLRVLVVDDEPDIRDLLTRLLLEQGCEVKAASSAAEALLQLGAFEPEVLLSDVGMPGTDGYELLRRIRSSGCSPPAAVAVTAYARPQDRGRALAAGFDDHLSKPVDQAKLVRALSNARARSIQDRSAARGQLDDRAAAELSLDVNPPVVAVDDAPHERQA